VKFLFFFWSTTADQQTWPDKPLAELPSQAHWQRVGSSSTCTPLCLNPGWNLVKFHQYKFIKKNRKAFFPPNQWPKTSNTSILGIRLLGYWCILAVGFKEKVALQWTKKLQFAAECFSTRIRHIAEQNQNVSLEGRCSITRKKAARCSRTSAARSFPFTKIKLLGSCLFHLQTSGCWVALSFPFTNIKLLSKHAAHGLHLQLDHGCTDNSWLSRHKFMWLRSQSTLSMQTPYKVVTGRYWGW